MTKVDNGKLLLNERLADYTTWRVGGVAKAIYKPINLDDLVLFLQQLPINEPLLWLGLGSNSLIKDQGFSGTVIVTQGGLNALSIVDDDKIRAEAGVSCAQLARFCARNEFSDGEFWAGIPGTVGGALRMNAGCFNGETWSCVTEVETLTRAGEKRRRLASEFTVSYRHVLGLDNDEWFVSATFKLPKGDKNKSLELIKKLLEHRADTQPTSEYNCGSVFRNPPNNFAAKLIESCGLKGFQLGGAKVSDKHANFIINHEGKATAADIENLIHHVQNIVYEKQNIQLTQEVHIIGDK